MLRREASYTRTLYLVIDHLKSLEGLKDAPDTAFYTLFFELLRGSIKLPEKPSLNRGVHEMGTFDAQEEPSLFYRPE